MIYFKDTTDFSIDGPCAVTLGKFDGLHLGHRKLMHRILEAIPGKGVVFALNARKDSLLLTPEEEYELVHKMGMYALIDCPFVPEISGMDPATFIDRILIGRLHAAYVAVGTDFRFGHRRAGDAQFLKSYAQARGVKVDIIEKECWQGREISSTYIREALAAGNMELVTALQGRAYSVSGTIVHGRHIGTTLGMPTANIIPDPAKVLPPDGVYYSVSIVEGRSPGEAYRMSGVSNIGFKPTIGERFRGIETYLFKENEELYGRKIVTYLLHYARGEVRFDGLEALKEQIRRDISQGREYFDEQGIVEREPVAADPGRTDGGSGGASSGLCAAEGGTEGSCTGESC